MILMVWGLDQTERFCPLDHGTGNRCNYRKVIIAKLQSSSTVQVAFAGYFVENIFSKRCTFWSVREWRVIFLNTYVNGRFVWWRWPESLWQKWLLCSVTVVKISFFCDTTLFLNKLTTYQPPYMVTSSCLWSVGCQIVSVLTFLMGASAKLKLGHMNRYAVR